MVKSTPVLLLGGAIALGGCSVLPPNAPQVMALPAANKDFPTFQREDMACRQAASQAIGVPPAAPGSPPPQPVPLDVAADQQHVFDTTYTQCMYAKGNQVTAPPPPVLYDGGPYAGTYSPGYYGLGYGGFYGVGIGFGGGYWGGGYRGGWGGYRGGYAGGGGWGGHGGFRR